MNNLRLAMAFAFAILCCCSGSLTSVATGGSSQQGNGLISGTALAATGKPAAGATVRVRPHYYVETLLPEAISGKTFDTVTDAGGHFSVRGVMPDSFTVEINDLECSAVAVSVGLTLQDSVVDLGTRILKPYAKITGILDTTGSGGRRFFIQVLGLERLVQVDTAGRFAFANLPEGTYNLRLQSFGPAPVSVDASHVRALSGETDSVAISLAYRYFSRMYLNTTASGAGISGSVFNFPVLVRLSNANFDFSQAAADGKDIRFEKPDGAALSFEIERWDASQGSAEIWVKIDTVFGNDSTHSITMYWGNQNAANASNSQAVFDTANGFEAVLHLNEAAGQTATDATANHFDATPSDTAPIAVQGTIGLAQHFNGVSSSLQMKGTAGGRLNFPENGRFTVSAWVNVDTLIDSVTRLIVAKGPKQYYLKLFSGNQQKQWEFTEFVDNAGFQITSDTPVVARSWKYLVGVHDGSDQYLYLDGALVNFSNSVPIGTAPGLRDTTADVSIGKYLTFVTGWNQGYAFFDGAIDEVCIANVARGTDWIKLSYMNQNVPDRLLVMR